MSDSELQSLKADFLEWTGGFDPESEEDISAYVETSMPFDLDPNAACAALREWMRETGSLQVRRNVDQH
jgi:hypothetical protein